MINLTLTNPMKLRDSPVAGRGRRRGAFGAVPRTFGHLARGEGREAPKHGGWSVYLPSRE